MPRFVFKRHTLHTERITITADNDVEARLKITEDDLYQANTEVRTLVYEYRLDYQGELPEELPGA